MTGATKNATRGFVVAAIKHATEQVLEIAGQCIRTNTLVAKARNQARFDALDERVQALERRACIESKSLQSLNIGDATEIEGQWWVTRGDGRVRKIEGA